MKGLACDNVDEFEAVLHNGTIVTATATENPDLWWALRGGGNQFAIVTKMKLQAHPAGVDGKIWGGTRAYSPGKRKELFNALAKFVRDYPDEKAAIIPTFEFGLPLNILNAVTGPVLFFFTMVRSHRKECLTISTLSNQSRTTRRPDRTMI